MSDVVAPKADGGLYKTVTSNRITMPETAEGTTTRVATALGRAPIP